MAALYRARVFGDDRMVSSTTNCPGYMAAVDTVQKEASSVALPGLGRALMSAGKLTQKSAEEIY
jgi:hypothetical protein